MKAATSRKIAFAIIAHIVAGLILYTLQQSGYLQPAVGAVLYGEMRLAPGQRDNPLVGRLLREDFDALDTAFVSAREAFRADVEKEADYYRLFNDAAVPQRGAQPLLNRWVQARPLSTHALLVRAQHFFERAQAARGTKAFSEVSSFRRFAYSRLLSNAEDDLAAALALDPGLHKAHTLRILVYQYRGSHAAQRQAFQAALEISPYSEVPRWVYLFASAPEWGGSEAQMRRIVEEAQQHLAKNPRLAMIEAGLLAWQGRRQASAQGDCASLNKFGESVRVHPTTPGRMGLARAAVCTTQLDLAEEQLAAVLESHPGHMDALRVRYQMQLMREQFKAAESTARSAVYYQPFEAESWYMLGSMHLHRGQFESAHNAFLRALALDPDNFYYTGYEQLARDLRNAPDKPATLILTSDNGELIEKTQYLHGRRNGISREYRGGQVFSSRTYVDGVLNGPARSFYAETGELQRESYFDRGVREGELLEYSRSGAVTARYFYRNGVLEGPAERFYPDGAVRARQDWVSGKLHGEVRIHAPDGALRVVTQFKEGVRDGEMRVHAADGAVVGRWRFRAGELADDSPGYLDGHETAFGKYRITLTTELLPNYIGIDDRNRFLIDRDWIRFHVQWQNIDDEEHLYELVILDAAGKKASEFRHSGVGRDGWSYAWTEVFPTSLQHAPGQWWAIHRVDGIEVSRRAFEVAAAAARQ